MPAVFATLLDNSLKASVVILVVLLLRLLLRRAPKKFSYALWVLVAFRLLVPVSIPSALSIFGVARIADDTPFADLYATTAVVTTTAPNEITTPNGAVTPNTTTPSVTDPKITDPDVTDTENASPSVTTPTVTDPTVTTPVVTDPPITSPTVTAPTTTVPPVIGPVISENTTTPPTPSAPIQGEAGGVASSTSALDLNRTLFSVASCLWLLGVLVLLTYAVVSYVKLRRQLQNARHLEKNVYLSKTIDSPFALGFVHPKIYLPEGLSDTERECILAHEGYHLRRGDHIIKPLSYLLLCLHWFNPLCWLAFHLMSRDMEMSCDEKILSSSDDPAFKKQYSLTLLALASKRPLLSASPIAFSDGGGAKKRILHAMNWKKPKLWISIVAVILCVITIVICATDAIVKDDDTDTTTEDVTTTDTTEPTPSPVEDFEYEIITVSEETKYILEVGDYSDTYIDIRLDSEGLICITKYVGTDKNVVIPSEIDGIPVNSIGYEAFANTTVETVWLPESVENIVDRAFYEHPTLTAVYGGKGLRMIGTEAFGKCHELTTINLSSDTLKIILKSAFYDCLKLTDVTLGSALAEIGNQAFAYCLSLQSITIPKSIVALGFESFAGCISLSDLTLEDGIATFYSGNFIAAMSLKTITIPASVTKMDAYLFYPDYFGLTEVIFKGDAPTILLEPPLSPSDLVIYYDPNTEGWDTTPLRDYFTLVAISDDPPTTNEPPVTTEPPVTEPPFITDVIAFHPNITITDIGDLDPMYLSGFSQGYALVVVADDRGESFVFVNKEGELLTQERFAMAYPFDESGKALVQLKIGRWYYLNTDGELESETKAPAQITADETILYEEDGKYGIQTPDGFHWTKPIFVVPPAFYPNQTYAMATMSKGEDTIPVLVSVAGYIIELPEGTSDAYYCPSNLYNNRVVCRGIGYGEDSYDTVLDVWGNEILSERYSLVLPCGGKWFAVIQDGKLGLLDWDGNVLIPPSVSCDWSPDMRIGYGEGYLTVQINGKLAFVKIVEPAPAPKPTLPEGTPLTAEQITEIENFLNEEENNGFISYTNEYAKPEDIDLWLVFYNIGTHCYYWSEEERDGVLAAGIWDEYYVGTYKIEKSYADALLRKRTGLSLDDFGGTIPYFHYIEAYDAFYNMHSDTTYDPVWAIDGVIDENGNYVVRYKSGSISNLCIVTLRKTDDGYQFISNLESDATLSASSDFDWDYLETDEEVSSNVTHEYTDTASETTHKLLISAEKTMRNVTFFTVKKEELSGSNMPDKVLYRLETLSPNESLLIHTDLGVLTALRGFCFTGEDGFTYYYTMEYNEWEERYYLRRIAVRTKNSLLLPASTQQNPSTLLEEPFLSILKNEQKFVYVEQERHLSDFAFGARSYTVIDFDSDGKNECVVEIADGSVLILRDNGDKVVGFARRVQAMYQINTDGTFYWNDNAGNTQGCSRLQFSEDGYHTVEMELWRRERDENGSMTYYVNNTPVSEEEYIAATAEIKTSVVWHPYSEISIEPPVTEPPVTEPEPPVIEPPTTEPSDSPFTLQFYQSYEEYPRENVLICSDPFTSPENSQLPFLVMVKETVKNVTFFTVDGANTELPEYTLKTWEELTPGKPLLIYTYLNDATITRGISYTDEDGTTYYYGFDCDLSGLREQPYYLRLLDTDTSGTPLPSVPTPPVTFENYLSNEQLQEIETFLNARANNGFVQANTYYKPQGIDLNWAFYHGGGAGIPIEELTDEELRIFVSEGRNAFNLKHVMRRSDIDTFLQKVTGLSLDHFVEMDRNEFVYSEGLDAYLDCHTDAAYSVVMVLSGGIDESGNYVVYYREGYGGVMVVTLRPTNDGYQFISNLPTDIELPTDPFEVDFKDPEEVTDTSGVHVYTDKEAETVERLVQLSTHQTVKDFALFELVEVDSEIISPSYAPGKTLYTLDELTPDKPFLLKTNDDRRWNLGYRYTDENGYTYYYTLSWGGLFDVSIGVVTTEPSTPAAPIDLTATQLQEIEDFLNDVENNGFVGTLNLYAKPDYIDLYFAFRDGAGIGVWEQDWSAEEKEAFNAIFGSGHNSRYLRIDRIDLTVHLLKKTGLDRQRFATTMHGFTYSEELDAYFTGHTDTEYHEVEVTGGYIDEYGTHVVHYDYYDDHCTVTLRKVKNGYQFLSNLCEEKTPNYPLFIWDATSSPERESTSHEYIEEIVDGSSSDDYLIFHLRTPLKNVTYFALEGDTLTPLATWEELLPEDSLLIGTRVSDGTFTRGFSYDDESGVTHYFVLHPSKEDHWLYTHHLALSKYYP